MQLIEWELDEDGYEEQLNIPKTQRDIAAAEGISTEVGRKVGGANSESKDQRVLYWPISHYWHKSNLFTR